MTDIEASRVIKCPKCGANLSAKLVCELRDAETYQVPIEHGKVYQKFTPEQANKLTITNVDQDYVYLKPKTWLGSADFAEIAQVVKDLGGEWIAQGKDSHFKIPREAFA